MTNKTFYNPDARKHRDDFEPFVDEDVTFERHLQLLEQDGTYAGSNFGAKPICLLAILSNAILSNAILSNAIQSSCHFDNSSF